MDSRSKERWKELDDRIRKVGSVAFYSDMITLPLY